ncbi:MAG: hypothetical protein D6808_06075, partial [Candidatus Dadabacteria bacterium]
IKLIIVLIVIGLSCYIFYLNPKPITVYTGGESKITAPAAIILISVFLAGMVFSSLFALYFGLKAFWREKVLRDSERKRAYSAALEREARDLLASGEWLQAKQKWEAIIAKDPDNITARIELSRSLEGDGDLRGALKVIDAARAVDSTSIEVLFRAAEINLRLQNKTAAIDNLALILYHSPNKKAAIMARDLSESIGRIQDALEYNQMAGKLGADKDDIEDTELRLKLKALIIQNENDRSLLKSELRKFIKKNPAFVPALYYLSSICAKEGAVEEAAKLLASAFNHSKDPCYWQEAAELWLQAGQPERAISAIKACIKESTGKLQVKARLDLIRLYLKLNMVEEAGVEIADLESILSNEDELSYEEEIRALIYLKGRYSNLLGNYKESAILWQRLIDSEITLKGERDPQKEESNGKPLSARFSTP